MSEEAVCIEIDKKLYERIESLPDAQWLAPRQIIHDALQAYLGYKEKKDIFLRDAKKSWEEFQRTGLHVTLEEIETWMDSWGTDNELPMPQAHK